VGGVSAVILTRLHRGRDLLLRELVDRLLNGLGKHAVRIDGDKQALAARQHLAFFVEYLRFISVPAALDFELARFDAQRLMERHGLEVIHSHLGSHGDDLAQLVYLAHGFVEDGGDDAAMAVSGRPGVALAEAEAADEAVAFLVIGETQLHAVGVVGAADEAAIGRQFYVARVVSGTVLFTSVSLASLFLTSLSLVSLSLSGHRKILSRGGCEIGYHGVRIVDAQEVAMSRAGKTQAPYSVHPSVAMVQKGIEELKQKTGRSLEEWIALTRESGPPTEKERREWLKKEHNLGMNSATWIAERVDSKGTAAFDSPETYLKAAAGWVEAQYSGPRAALRPLHEQLLELGFSLGKDVKACPCRTMVPFYRNHVFAQIKPSTNTRIDLGFALGNMKTPKRLIDTGGYETKDRITRRIEIRSKGDIDDEVKGWLKRAYEIDK
jgi:hypothetical protein